MGALGGSTQLDELRTWVVPMFYMKMIIYPRNSIDVFQQSREELEPPPCKSLYLLESILDECSNSIIV